MIESLQLLDKAEDSFRAAELLVDAEAMDSAASRTYYAWFYVAEGLLLARGARFSRHGQVIAQYGNHFARTGDLDPEFHHLLIRAFNLRQMADYWSQVEISSETVNLLIVEGRRFLAAAHGYLENSSPPTEVS